MYWQGLSKTNDLKHNDLKYADIVTVHKKKSKTNKTNHRPAGILSNFSKSYEKLKYKQLYQHVEAIFSSSQCGFWKVYSAQHCCLLMIEKFKKQLITVMNSVQFWLTFECIWLLLSLIITKYWWYKVSHTSFELIFSCFEIQTQRTNINNCFSK